MIMKWNVLKCKRCTAHFVPQDEETSFCAACAPAILASMLAAASANEPRRRYELTGTDESFLKNLGISPD